MIANLWKCWKNDNVQSQAIPDIQNSNVGIINENQVTENNVSDELVEPNDVTSNSKKDKQLGEPINGNGDANEIQIDDLNTSKQNAVEIKNPTINSKFQKRLDNARIEKHKAHVMDHNLVVSGVNVSERKERTLVTVEDIKGNKIAEGNPIKTIIVHTRSIGERKYAMKETKDINGKVTDSKVVTEMSDEDIKKFEEDWKDYWIPTITDEQIESGEFENELNALKEKEPIESVKINMSEDKEIKKQSIERICHRRPRHFLRIKREILDCR